MRLKLFTLIAASCMHLTAVATEIVHYNNKPVIVQLHAGEERKIQFGDHVKVGVTRKQEVEQLFRVQSAQGAVLVRPGKPFERERVVIKRITDGKVVLLDLIATDAPANAQPLEDMRVYLENENSIEQEVKAKEEQVAKKGPPITPITLTRYAAQKLYAPTRLHNDIPGISEANLNVVLNKEVRAFKGINRAQTRVKPVLAYRANDLYIVALLVRNTTNESVTLNYLDINLPFSHATYQHHQLSRRGTAGDRTILYLVNDRPLAETLVPWTFYAVQAEDAKGGNTQ